MALNLFEIKSAFQSIMSAANTTTADYDLSTGMRAAPGRPVQKVLTVNPDVIPVQASMFPFVTIFNGSKSVELATMAGDQVRGKRMADLRFHVLGAVWCGQTTRTTDDRSEEQVGYLMENVEEVLRRNFKLNGTVLWSKPESIGYYTSILKNQEQDAQLRFGAMSLLCKINY